MNAVIDDGNLVNFMGGPEVVTFSPSGTTANIMPTIDAPGSNNGTLVYEGNTYSNLQITLNANGEAAIMSNDVANNPEVGGLYGNDTSYVPFLLTGTVTAYSSPPNSQGCRRSAPLHLEFLGGGLYNATASGYFNGPGGDSGTTTYQFLQNPIDFRTDTNTQSTWSHVYGGEGYLIANGPSELPRYATVSLTGASTYTWSTNGDLRALQNGYNATTAIASTYYGNNFNIDIRPIDSDPHVVALYFLDYDNSGRSETVTITNADTGAVLDTQTISNFQFGTYAIWNLAGNIRINLQGANGSSAEVSGVFFGPPFTLLNPPPAGEGTSSFALFRGTNGTVKGAWEGHYGSAGYLIANGPGSAPLNATVNVAGAIPYTWAAVTSDPRALELNPQGTSGIASTFTQYPTNSFKIYVTSSALEQLSLYLLDWDNAGHAETITITDLSTGLVLDSEIGFAFQGAASYYSWEIFGSVVVTITPFGNDTPTVSGVFLDNHPLY